MLHILLFILKIIGIIIAAILGILVLLVCVVLFVPGRYDIEASCDGSFSEIRAAARVTWFLNLIKFNACYENKEVTWRLRIAWKNRQSGQESKKKIKKEVETYGEEMEELWKDSEENVEERSEENEKVVGTPKEIREEEDKPGQSEKILEEIQDESEKSYGETEKVAERLSESGESLEKQTNVGEDMEEAEAGVDEDMEEAEAGIDKDMEEAETGADEDMEEAEAGIDKDMEEAETGTGKGLEENERCSEKERKHIWQKIADSCQKIIRKIADLYRKITEIPGKIGEIFQKFSDRIKTLSEKKNKIIDFITDEVHKKALVKVRDEGLYLLKKLKPKKFLAEIHFGFDDPCLTGKLLDGVSMAYPFLGKNVDVSPDFERQVLEGNLKIAGRIRVSYFARLLWRLIWCREVRMTYKHVRNFEF